MTTKDRLKGSVNLNDVDKVKSFEIYVLNHDHTVIDFISNTRTRLLFEMLKMSYIEHYALDSKGRTRNQFRYTSTEQNKREILKRLRIAEDTYYKNLKDLLNKQIVFKHQGSNMYLFNENMMNVNINLKLPKA